MNKSTTWMPRLNLLTKDNLNLILILLFDQWEDWVIDRVEHFGRELNLNIVLAWLIDWFWNHQMRGIGAECIRNRTWIPTQECNSALKTQSDLILDTEMKFFPLDRCIYINLRLNRTTFYTNPPIRSSKRAHTRILRKTRFEIIGER